MIVAIGRIMKENYLIGLRIFDTETKKTKDIRIEDKDKIKIKNIKSLNKLGIVDNRQEDKPIINLGEKDSKYITVDINGNTRILNSLEGYSYIDLLTNIEQYNKYITKSSLIGEEPYFKFEIKEETDEVLITRYIKNKEEYRVITIPPFVTGIKPGRNGKGDIISSPFTWIKQSLKVLYKGNKIVSMKGMFYKYEGSKLDLSNFNTSHVTDMSGMFEWCYILKDLDLSNFDTSQVTDMNYMFWRCSSLKELDVSNFDTSHVTDMSHMFYECYGLEELDLSNFDTSKVTNIHGMFEECHKLKKLDLRKFDTSKVTDMSHMFDECDNLKELDLSNFDTSKVTDINEMFKKCWKLKKLDLSNFDTSKIKYMYEMFYDCYNLEELDISNFNTSKVINMRAMFCDCRNLKKLDLSKFDTSKVTNMCGIFTNTSLTPENTGLKIKE